MSDVYLRAPSLLVLKNGFNALCDAVLTPRFVDATLGVVRGASVKAGIRWDVDLIDDLVSVPAVLGTGGSIITPSVTRGLHCNLRVTTHDASPATLAEAIRIRAAIVDFVTALPQVLDVLPAGVIAAYGVAGKTYRTSGSGIVFLNPDPNPLKQTWEA